MDLLHESSLHEGSFQDENSSLRICLVICIHGSALNILGLGLHADFTFPLNGKIFLILVPTGWECTSSCSYYNSDKWSPEVNICHTWSFGSILGTSLTSADMVFEMGIHPNTTHVLPSPHHPSSNGLVERVLQHSRQNWRKPQKEVWRLEFHDSCSVTTSLLTQWTVNYCWVESHIHN